MTTNPLEPRIIEETVVDRRFWTSNKNLFPDSYYDEKDRIIVRTKYIIAGRNECPFEEKGEYLLRQRGQKREEFKVRVIKLRQCSPEAKWFALLESDKPLTALETLEGSVNVMTIKGEDKGQIHSGFGMGHGTQHSGGQAYAYGVNFLIRNGTAQPELPHGSNADQICTYEIAGDSQGVKVAVLDTGIYFSREHDRSRTTTCGQNEQAWDFTHSDQFPVEDHAGFHGTKISTIVRHTFSDTKLVPVKVTNFGGVVDLFDVLCGLEYARVNGVRVVNASWTFSSNSKDGYPLLSDAVIDLKLGAKKAFVVAAAGNLAPRQRGRSNNPYVFPAFYSDQDYVYEDSSVRIDNVITVTSVIAQHNEDGSVSYVVSENTSDEYVDIGVVTNVKGRGTPADLNKFNIPGFAQPERGTSFAAAFVSGKLAKVICQIEQSSKALPDKQLILAEMPGHGQSSELATVIKGGNYVEI